MKALAACAFLVVCGGMMACDDDDKDDTKTRVCQPDLAYDPEIKPENFSLPVTNTWFPLVPGTRFVYESGDETIEVTVTDDKKGILGVSTTVVRDVVTEDGVIVEDTLDYFATDNDGNVWYFGEDTKEYEDGKLVGTEGSWRAGVDGARPGLIMYANPPVGGEPYRQEYLACEAEDMAEVVSKTETVSVPFGDFDDALQTREFTPLEPQANEYKYYAPGVGLVLEVDVNTGERVELVEVTGP